MVLTSARCRAATLSRGHAIAAVSAVALLAGCAVGPDFVAPQAPPTKDYEFGGMPQPGVENAADPQQRFSMGQKISGDSWQLFHSSQLDGVLQQAIAGNQTLVTAQANVAQAQQGIAQASGALWPQVDFAAGAHRERVNLAAVGINGQSQAPIINLFSIGPTLSYAVDPFGGNRRRVEQQEATTQFQEYQLDAAYLTLTGGAATQAVPIASAPAQIPAHAAPLPPSPPTLPLLTPLARPPPTPSPRRHRGRRPFSPPPAACLTSAAMCWGRSSAVARCGRRSRRRSVPSTQRSPPTSRPC